MCDSFEHLRVFSSDWKRAIRANINILKKEYIILLTGEIQINSYIYVHLNLYLYMYFIILYILFILFILLIYFISFTILQ